MKESNMLNTENYFISLQSTPKRTDNFLYYNQHIPGIMLFRAKDGRKFFADHSLPDGILSRCCKWTAGAIGCGLSHASLWMNAVKTSNIKTIFEDDALLCKNFENEHKRILAALPRD